MSGMRRTPNRDLNAAINLRNMAMSSMVSACKRGGLWPQFEELR
jgi:hypothetical protein